MGRARRSSSGKRANKEHRQGGDSGRYGEGKGWTLRRGEKGMGNEMGQAPNQASDSSGGGG